VGDQEKQSAQPAVPF